MLQMQVKMGKLPPSPYSMFIARVVECSQPLWVHRVGGGEAKAPNVYDGNSSMGVSQHDLLRIEAKDTCIILAIILPGYKHKYICTTMVQMGLSFEITAKP